MFIHFLGGGLKHFACSPLPREMIQFDKYFSNGLKSPTIIGKMVVPLGWYPSFLTARLKPFTRGLGQKTYPLLIYCVTRGVDY